ncbi:MAG: 50S ribosomal protein L11 methyltransferase [Chloroflexi bacterium]|nr:50S ribosomal protein L11 methyltransferase [Chloroflexota bacterium]
MQWLELRIRVSSELVEPVTDLFRRYSDNAVAVEEPGGFYPDEGDLPPGATSATVLTYLPDDSRGRRAKARIEAGLRLLALIQPVPSLSQRLVEQREWEEGWKDHFPVISIGKRLVIAPPWARLSPKRGQAVVLLDPGLAFGTGHHPTTRHCLEELEQRVRPESDVLDVGTGSGILAIAAAKLEAHRILALDTDPVAVRVARRNARLNQVDKAVRIVRGTLPRPERFDLVLSNISAKAIGEMALVLQGSLKPEGVLIASGFLEERRREVTQRFSEAGLTVTRVRRTQDWVTLLAQTGSGVGVSPTASSEPPRTKNSPPWPQGRRHR